MDKLSFAFPEKGKLYKNKNVKQKLQKCGQNSKKVKVNLWYLPLRPAARKKCTQYYRTILCHSFSSSDEEKERELERIAREASIDDPPTACCRTGCANCVFIVWAETLASKMQNAGPEIADKILKSVDDPSMKAYLEMELRIRGLKK